MRKNIVAGNWKMNTTLCRKLENEHHACRRFGIG